jgi:DNA-binding GntR family transcriptional regulator
MMDMLRGIDDRIRFVRTFDITNADRLAATCEQHLEILEAIRRRDAAKAVAVLRRNLKGGRIQAESAVKEALANAHAIYG